MSGTEYGVGAAPARGVGPREGLRPGTVWPVGIDPWGTDGPTRGSARGPRYRRTSHGLYVPADVERTVEQRIVEAAALLHGWGGVTGWAALRWLGGYWFDGWQPTVVRRRP